VSRLTNFAAVYLWVIYLCQAVKQYRIDNSKRRLTAGVKGRCQELSDHASFINIYSSIV